MTRRELAVTDEKQIRSILDGAKLLHLGLIRDGMPYVVSMNYGYTLEEGKLTLYLHSAKDAGKLALLRENPACYVSMECDVRPFTGRIACQYGVAYYALTGTGRAVIVEDTDEKCAAMTRLMKTQTGGDFVFDEKLVSIVSVIRVEMDGFEAKYRPAPGERPE